jgi:2-oxoglutarate dehydrogenase E2 component (dihydrolipoamide succinyltransferase)
MSEVKLPALGESVTEGTVTRWLKKIGDTVAIDEPLVEVSTDKVDTEIPSPVAGVLQQILVQEDEVALVGAVLAIVGDGVAASAAPVTAPPVVEAPVTAPVVVEPIAAPVVAPVAPPVFTPQMTTPPAALPVFTPQVSPPVSTPVAAKVESNSDAS